MFSKADFQQWKDGAITKELHKNMLDRIEDIRDLLETGASPQEEAQFRGIIVAFREILGWEPELEEEDA